MLIEKKYFLNEDHQFVGSWWLPEKPDEKIIGILKFSQNSIVLELEGTLAGDERGVIFGYASGRKISIYETYPLKTTILPAFSSNPNLDAYYYPSSHGCSTVLINSHLETLKDFLIDRALVSFGQTKVWTKFTGLTSRDGREEVFSYEYLFSRPEQLVLYEDADIEVNLINNFRLPGASNLEEETVILEENIFSFENSSGVGGLFFFEHMNALRHFISIAAQFPFNPCHVQLTEKNGANSHLLFCVNPIEHFNRRNKLDITSFLFDPKNIENAISHYYANWFRFFESGGDVSHLYLKKKSTPHENFLAIAQALEHHFELQYSKNTKIKEYSAKIGHLYQVYGSGLEHIVDENSFAKMMADSRNYYSHFMLKKKAAALRGNDLYNLSLLANYLLTVCLLTRLGFSVEESMNRCAKQLAGLKNFISLPS